MTSTMYVSEIQPAPSTAARLLKVVRLHLVNRSQIIVVPWLIMAFIFFVSLVIGVIFRAAMSPETLADANEGMQFNGAMGYFLIYMLVLAVMAISQTFPFAQSYSVTRKDFYLGTVITFFGLSFAYSLAITVLGWLEGITSGWGVNVILFNPGYLSPNFAERFYIALVLFLFFFMTGMATASVYVRWKTNGMLVFFGALILAIVGIVALVTHFGQWPAVGNWFVSMGLLGVVSWSLVPSTLAALAGYAVLRKATPRN